MNPLILHNNCHQKTSNSDLRQVTSLTRGWEFPLSFLLLMRLLLWFCREEQQNSSMHFIQTILTLRMIFQCTTPIVWEPEVFFYLILLRMYPNCRVLRFQDEQGDNSICGERKLMGLMFISSAFHYLLQPFNKGRCFGVNVLIIKIDEGWDIISSVVFTIASVPCLS